MVNNILRGWMRELGAWLGRVLIVLLLALPVTVRAQLTFTTNNGAITIAGYTGSNGTVVIPDTTNGYLVTSIGDGAFNYCLTLTNIIIPSSINNIGVLAFYGCFDLASITIPDSVTNIGAGAFNSCHQLNNVVGPASVTSIGDYAFVFCTKLLAIEVKSANPAYCSADGVLFNKDQTILMQFPSGKAGSYTIPGSVTSLADEAIGIDDHGQYPFPYTACAGLTNLIIPGSITNLEAHAFSHCSGLAHVVLASGVSSIGTNAFSWCANLATIAIPSSVTCINDSAFFYSGLTEVTIPGSVTNLGIGAFGVCSNLAKVTLQDGVTSIGEAGFNFCTALTNITIPPSMTSIGDRAFWFCTGLPHIVIPCNVTNIGAYAFSGCAHLMDIDVSTNNLFYSSADGVLFDKDQTTLIQFPGGRGGSYTIPDSVINIGNLAFATYDPSYGYYSSQYLPSCVNLSNLTIDANITSIGTEGFGSLHNLSSIHFEGDVPANPGDLLYDFNITFYLLPGNQALSEFYSSSVWLPEMQMTGPAYGVQTNWFGFNIQWARGQAVVVEACTNLANPDWQPVQTNALPTGSAAFSDSGWMNNPGRFYRLRSL